MSTRAVILAAGMSSRLRPLTDNIPKCMLEIDGVSLIERSIKLLISRGITDFTIVTGYKENKLRDHLLSLIENEDNEKLTISFVYNHNYEQTNNMLSLYLGLVHNFDRYEDTIYLHSDIIYDEEILDDMLEEQKKDSDTILMSTDFNKELTSESMKIEYHKNKWFPDRIISSKSLEIGNRTGEWIGITILPYDAKFELIKRISEQLINYGVNSESNSTINFYQQYDTFAFSNLNYPFKLVSTKLHRWMEMDTKEDFDLAIEVFSCEDRKVEDNTLGD
jgi:choline kinase